jgi:hypothetical protein
LFILSIIGSKPRIKDMSYTLNTNINIWLVVTIIYSHLIL